MSRHPRARFTMRRDRPPTWQDLLELPDDVVGEIVNGELVVTPRPGGPHTVVSSDLTIALGGPFRMGIGGPGGWIFLDEPRIRFADEIRAPDLAAWRRERWGGVPKEGPLTLVPDWVGEVLSLSTESDDRTAKMSLYRRAGVRHVWLVSHRTRTLEVYRLEPTGWLVVATFAGNVRVRAEPFDAVELDLGSIWAGLGEPESPEE